MIMEQKKYKEDTSICNNGCYLLINIKVHDLDEIIENINFFSITIMATLTNKNNLNLIPIKFDYNDYIVGYLINDYSELYEYNIPYKGESIDIEFYSENVKLLVYIENDNNIINYDKPDFQIVTNGIYNIPKKNISDNDIDNIKFIILASIYNDKENNLEPIININKYSYYSFKININHKKDDYLKIYKISTEQKVFCQPQKYNNIYVCLFLIELNRINLNYHTIIYAKSPNSILNMYGDLFVKYLYYEDYNETINNIPNENSEFNNIVNNEIVDFIFISKNDNLYPEDYFIYISVYSKSSDTIEFIATSYDYYNRLIPTSNLKEFFGLDSNLENKINLNFLTQNAIMINIASLYGKGEFYFNNKLYNLEENNNKISLILNSNVDENINFKLKNEKIIDEKDDCNNNNILKDSIKIPEFVFYIEYNFRNSKINLDKININLQDNSEITYQKPEFPYYIYSDINNYDKDMNIIFKFNGINTKNKDYLSTFKINDDLKISYLIIEKKNILDYIKNKQKYLEIQGIIDPSISIGQIYITKGILQKYKNNNDNTLLLVIDKKGEDKNIFYEEINIKSCIINENENSTISIVENAYYYGKLQDINIKNKYKYKLKLDKSYSYIYIQFSTNSEMVDYNILNDNEKIINKPFHDDKDGKKIVKLEITNNMNYIYLDIIWVNNQEVNQKLNNYVFKINYDIDIINKYKIIENNIITCKITKSKNRKKKMEIKFNKIENYINYDIIYSLKIVKKDDIKDDLKNELVKTIALTESNSNIIQIKNNDNNDKINISFDNIEDDFEDNFVYIEVIAQINDDYNTEYIAYEPIKSSKEITIDTTLETTTIFIILFEIISIIIIICLIIFLFYYKNQLEEKQNKHSIEMKIKPLIKYDDIILGKDEDNDYTINKNE